MQGLASQVKSSLFHRTLKSTQSRNSDKTMRSSRSTAPFSHTLQLQASKIKKNKK